MKLTVYLALVIAWVGAACNSGEVVSVEDISSVEDTSPAADLPPVADVAADTKPTDIAADTGPTDAVTDTDSGPEDSVILPDKVSPGDILPDLPLPQDLQPDTQCDPVDEVCNGIDDDCDGQVDEETCDDGNLCTTDSCDPLTGCIHTPNTNPCDDGNVCTTGDICGDGVCQGAGALGCDDGNVCTTDSCDPAVGCVNTDNTSPCDDGNACTTGDVCGGGVCQGAGALGCDDGNVCTTDSCNPTVGCVNTNNTSPCDDGNVCTTGDICGDGVCQGAGALGCDDGNVCTTDSCDPLTGCVHTLNTSPCDDGNPCTTADTCSAGACAGVLLPPDQVNIEECLCDSDADCLLLDDGNPCTGTLECVDATGTCGVVPGSAINCDEFSVILIPDTQYYTYKLPDDADNTYYKQMQWIVDWEDNYNIQFVIHLGDVTHHNVNSEWELADGAHAILDSAGVPYSMVPGNHDYYPSATFSRSQTKFNNYFGPDRFQGKPWYGGSYGSGNENNYSLFEIGQMEFMVLSVEHAPRKDILCWANDLIGSYPNRRVIIVTHCYLTHNGSYSTSCATSYDIVGGSGLTVWDELAGRHSNVFMVVCGHVGDSEHVPKPGNTGNTVHQMLVDYQFEGACSSSPCSNNCWAGLYTGNGWLRRLAFVPEENKVYATTYSVEVGNQSVFPQGAETLFCSELNTNGHNDYDMDPTAADHQFSFDYDLTSALPPYEGSVAGKEFNDRTVNSTGTGDQIKPIVAMNGSGDFMVVWEDNSDSSDGSSHDIFARGFQPGGCESFDDIAANTLTSGQQDSPSAAMDSDGNFVVVWRDDNDDNGVGQIYARGFNHDGSQSFGYMTVNSVPGGEQRRPVVAMEPNGSFVVVWEDDSSSSDGSGNYDLHARGFHANGAQKFGDIVVNATTGGQQLNPAIAMAPNGDFVVTWEDDNDGNGYFQIYARGFNANGTQKFGVFTVNSVGDGQQFSPAIAMDDDGNFVITWEDDQNKNGYYEILARGFNSNGAGAFSDMVVNSDYEGQQLAPAIAMKPDGDFVVVWEDDTDKNEWYEILARGFTAGGSEAIPDFTVNKEKAGQQFNPSVAIDSDGYFVVAWEDDMDKNGYYQILARGLAW